MITKNEMQLKARIKTRLWKLESPLKQCCKFIAWKDCWTEFPNPEKKTVLLSKVVFSFRQ